MSKQDISMKAWLKNKERFADLFNGIIFEGNQVIQSDDLELVNSEADVLFQTKDKIIKGVQRYRDVVMRWHNDIDLAILACENQEKVHYAMPVRTMLYDSLSYTEQMSLIWQNLSEEEKDGAQIEEIFSGFRKKDRIYPVITIVLYHGEEEWDGSRTLYEMFHLEHEELADILSKYIPDYWINLVDVKDVAAQVQFRTDIQIMFELLQYRSDKKKLWKYLNEHKEYFSHMDYEARLAMITLLNAEKMVNDIVKKDRGEMDMCKALQDWYDEALEIGMERGRSEGISEGISRGRELERTEAICNSISLLREVGTSDEVILELIIKRYQLPEEKVQTYLH